MVADSVKTAAMRAMLPKTYSNDSSMDPSTMKNFEIACLHMWERSWLDKTRTVEPNPWTLDRSTNPKERNEDVNAAQQRRPHDRSNQKHKQESDNERKLFNRRTANSSPSASRQSTPRDKQSGGVVRRNRVRGRRSVSSATGVVERGLPARLCPSAGDCQHVDEVGTEPSSDADSDLFWSGEAMTPTGPSTR